ncbi:ABC transporter permease [Ruminococcus flavefaciens]|uniref:ABC transporter permease n=1 Tax=Ruminococcus flavefaciens TaxID=1265 RepID=UPI000463EE98|nr:FtsX-like permease family protein [Ruminococcus flavefaciens]
MDILTLLKANIRRRKGTFISIVVLMFIISMALTLILSVSKSCDASLNELHSSAHSGNVTVMIKDAVFTDDMRQKLDNEAILDHYKVTPVAVMSNGMDCGDVSNENSCFFSVLTEGIRLVNKSCSGYEDSIPPLSKGEIYLSYGSKNRLKCNIGDKVTAHANGGDFDFTIKGFVAEPVFGAMQIGWKWQFISQEDFDMITAANAAQNDVDGKWGTGYIVQLYKSDDCGLSDGKFRRQVNLDSDIISNSWGSVTLDMSKHYTNIYSDNILAILLVFILILAVVVLIVAGHSISTGIELDYTNLGILKSQGFSSSRIRLSIMLQYLIAELVGSIIGVLAALPLIGVLTGFFDPMSGYITETSADLSKTLLYLLAIFAVSVVFILIITHKVCRISPIRAISGGRREIYFDSRLKAPISAKFLSSTLALRQFTSAKRRYIASVIIAAILVFFMLMVNALSTAASSRKALKMMGVGYVDLFIDFNETKSREEIDRVMDTVKENGGLQTRYFSHGVYLSLDGEEIYCSIDLYPEDIYVTKGRAPKYDNEIVITEIAADEFDLKIGDKVDIAKYDKHSEFIVSGLYPSMSDTGMSISMNADGAKKLDVKPRMVGGAVELAEGADPAKIKAALEKEYGDDIKVTIADENDEMEIYETAIQAMRFIIYSFSLFFALVAVTMVSTKAFTQEKTDIGIFKAQGFTTGKLRLQFAVRFLIVSVLGALLGTAMGMLLINKLLSVMLKGIGITSFYASFTPMSVIVPAAAICLCFFLFALFASRKIKKVGIRQLITE